MPEQREDRRWIAEKARIITRAVIDETCAIAEAVITAVPATTPEDEATKSIVTRIVATVRATIKTRE